LIQSIAVVEPIIPQASTPIRARDIIKLLLGVCVGVANHVEFFFIRDKLSTEQLFSGRQIDITDIKLSCDTVKDARDIKATTDKKYLHSGGYKPAPRNSRKGPEAGVD
jgi:hypothetical protein